MENQGELLRRLSTRFQRFVLFLLGTGVRLQECRGIDPAKDLHLKERWVRVTGKFGKTREVPLPSELVPVIEEQLKADGALWKQNPQRLREVLADGCRERTAIQARVSRRGNVVAAATGRTPLPHLSPHDLRHTYGHRWLVGGGDIFTLSRILGHESVAVTEKHYAYLLTENLRGAMDRVDLGLGLQTTKGKVVAMRRR
ncbi:MAG TPA: site-specific integrase [Vicinamibacterales bacterium]|nr:site-specific integrase [Vicinamibacterales bacterium]